MWKGHDFLAASPSSAFPSSGRDDPYWTCKKSSQELIRLSSIHKVTPPLKLRHPILLCSYSSIRIKELTDNIDMLTTEMEESKKFEFDWKVNILISMFRCA